MDIYLQESGAKWVWTSKQGLDLDDGATCTACDVACWHRHWHVAAIKCQAFAFELRFGLRKSDQANDGTKLMQHACRPAKATQEAERRQLLHGFLRFYVSELSASVYGAELLAKSGSRQRRAQDLDARDAGAETC